MLNFVQKSIDCRYVIYEKGSFIQPTYLAINTINLGSLSLVLFSPFDLYTQNGRVIKLMVPKITIMARLKHHT